MLKQFRKDLARKANDFAQFTADVTYDRQHVPAAELFGSYYMRCPFCLVF